MVYANEFARITGCPLATIKRLCKEGVIPYIPAGRKYLIDEAVAVKDLSEYGRQCTLPQKENTSPILPHRRNVSKKENITKNEALHKPSFLTALEVICKKNNKIC